MIGGVFLCFEGFEKVHQMLVPHDAPANAAHAASYADTRALEEEKVAGAIRTDFILSAEIMAISLASITTPDILTQAIVLFSVGVLVTAGVYGVVAIIVKADDFGVYLAQRGGTVTTAIGQATVYGMPLFLKMLSFVGLVAMLWVGGGIIIHGLHAYGIDGPEHVVQVISDAARATIPAIDGLLAWLAGAITSAILGLFIGAIAAFAVVPVLTPLWRAVRPAR
jgi:predicted DNA repair protein MutK